MLACRWSLLLLSPAVSTWMAGSLAGRRLADSCSRCTPKTTRQPEPPRQRRRATHDQRGESVRHVPPPGRPIRVRCTSPLGLLGRRRGEFDCKRASRRQPPRRNTTTPHTHTTDETHGEDAHRSRSSSALTWRLSAEEEEGLEERPITCQQLIDATRNGGRNIRKRAIDMRVHDKPFEVSKSFILFFVPPVIIQQQIMTPILELQTFQGFIICMIIGLPYPRLFITCKIHVSPFILGQLASVIGVTDSSVLCRPTVCSTTTAPRTLAAARWSPLVCSFNLVSSLIGVRLSAGALWRSAPVGLGPPWDES